ncbi:MAG: radical SAM protein [Deltaproteobacteria bacterium]|jgi:coproporphyrinogen III oxidase-like Fe-S oxidoreductase|nr:radical SAM protein [Deltaproteobacteria bacterium]MBW2533138.1 radical SAM protein [Deltaproteobacteria bacterium]
MTTAARERLEEHLRLALDLGPALVHRGVLQQFFVSPALPEETLSLDDIAGSWRRFAADVRAHRAPELVHLYVHVPFCSHRCRYCVYYSTGGYEPAQLESYLDRLHAELDYYGEVMEGVGITTCYFGGGTPTVLSPQQLADLLDHLDAAFTRKRGGEWAFECNPLTLDAEKARLFREHGFNRASFGVQTLNPRVLEGVNRGYQTRRRVAETFRILQEQNFWINVDLIQGLPKESQSSMVQTFEEILRFQPTQLTIYGISPFTPMDAVDADRLPPIGESLPQLMPIARSLGYRGASGSTCLHFSSKRRRRRNRLERERRWLGYHHNYDDTTIEPFSLLGLGPTARCYIYGRLRYMLDRAPVDAPFDPAALCATGRRVTMDEERRRFAVYQLERPSGLRESEFVRLFGQRLGDVFGAELGAARRLGLVRRRRDAYELTSDDPVRRFAAELSFVDPAMIESVRAELDRRREISEVASSSAPRADESDEPVRYEPTVELSASGVVVRVILADYWPGRPCYHHVGSFAFFVPSALPEGTCTLGARRELLLKAFALLFDDVVVRVDPAGVDALTEAVLAEANRRDGLRATVITAPQPPAVDVP